MFSVSIINFRRIVMRSELSGDVCDLTLGGGRVGGQQYWNVVVWRQPVRLARDAAAALRVRGRDGSQQREVIGLGQAPTAARYSAERHCVCDQATIVTLRLFTSAAVPATTVRRCGRLASDCCTDHRESAVLAPSQSQTVCREGLVPVTAALFLKKRWIYSLCKNIWHSYEKRFVI